MDTHSSRSDMDNDNLSVKRNEDNEKNCWDGSEAEFVDDEDVEEFEEHYSGIKFCYSLNDDEKEESAKILKESISSRQNKTMFKKNIIRTAVLAVAAAVFLVSFILGYGVVNIVMTALCVLVGLAMWYIPHLYLNKNVLYKSFNGTYNVTVYPHEVEVIKNNCKEEKLKEEKWIIPMDETGQFAEKDDLLVLISKEGNILTIPIRAIEPSFIADVQGILFTGTKPTEF
ncbi:MAG: hypothetical protein Q4B14_05880 [Clostridia bacterium]|nr:hypothetical protein [Clostridia bacterium]